MDPRDLTAMSFDTLTDACSYMMQEQRRAKTPGYAVMCEITINQIIDEIQHRDPQLVRFGIYGVMVTRNRGKTYFPVDWREQ